MASRTRKETGTPGGSVVRTAVRRRLSDPETSGAGSSNAKADGMGIGREAIKEPDDEVD